MVSANAAVPLWPMETPGSAGSPAPMMSSPGAVRCTTLRNDGKACSRCGSLASTARPVAVRDGATAQLFEPCKYTSPISDTLDQRHASSRVAASRAGLTSSCAVASRNTSSTSSGTQAGSNPSGTTTACGGSSERRARSVSSPAVAITRARAASDSTLRTRPWLRMRTTSAASQRSGRVPNAANSGGNSAGSASVSAIQALMPDTNASVMARASCVP